MACLCDVACGALDHQHTQKNHSAKNSFIPKNHLSPVGLFQMCFHKACMTPNELALPQQAIKKQLAQGNISKLFAGPILRLITFS